MIKKLPPFTKNEKTQCRGKEENAAISYCGCLCSVCREIIRQKAEDVKFRYSTSQRKK